MEKERQWKKIIGTTDNIYVNYCIEVKFPEFDSYCYTFKK